MEVNYYFTPVIIENPPTGMITIPFILIGALLVGIVLFKNKQKDKLYKI